MLAGKVSNKNVRRRIAVTILLLTAALCAQSKRSSDAAIVSRAKQAIISKFDPALPNLTLESFLKYETGDRNVDWSVGPCEGDHTARRAAPRDGRCVTAYSSLADARVISVRLQVAGDVSISPTLISVSAFEKGLEYRIRLIEIPAVAQGAKLGPRRPGPRDLLPLKRVA